ncbi:MAG: DegT/DnrJ/EryC1/StrS family aminotransferase [Chloroflexota bacterium]|nr:DegT/DnrJ/EryC1/StrS family aminotransferase [Chloroflexota bacterium]
MLKAIQVAHEQLSVSTKRSIPAQGNGRRLLSRLPQIQREVAAVIEASVDSGSHTNGPLVAELERRFAEALDVAAVLGVDCGSSALRAACELLRLPPGSEVLVPGYTFVMTAYAVSDAFAVDPVEHTFSKLGLVPVFVDVDPRTYTLDPSKARAAIGERTAAMIVVHMLGQMADMRPLLDLAQEHGLFVIEDAAQAHGATYRDALTGESWHAGAAGHFGCYSLSDVKNIGSFGSDAGILTLTQRLLDRYPDIVELARGWRNTGRMTAHRYRHQVWGLRARMDEYSAAECLAELEFLPEWNAHRRAIAARYDAALAGSWLCPPYVAPGRQHAFFAYMVKAPTIEARMDLARRLKAAGVQVADSYTVVADQEPYHTGVLPCRVETLEVSRELADLLVPIPCYPELTEEEIKRIAGVLAAR